MLEDDYHSYWETVCSHSIARPFKTMLTSDKVLTDVYFPEELISFFIHEAHSSEEEDITMYVSEQLLKLIHLSLTFADERGIDLTDLRSMNLVKMEKESV